jgi:aldehyde:ferredoxin oxidoreductase
MPFGYHGSYLRIDVSRPAAEPISLSEDLLRQFLGGSGLGVKLLLDEGAATADPLAPEAPLVFAFSPLVGSPLTTSAKFAVVSKSPLTQRINDSLASSGFAIAGKACGCDAMMIVGRASELSVLVIEGGEVRLEPAAEFRGATCRERQWP